MVSLRVLLSINFFGICIVQLHQLTVLLCSGGPCSGGLCPGGCLSRRVSLSRGSLSRGSLFRGKGSMSGGSLFGEEVSDLGRGSLFGGGGLCLGGLCPGGLCPGVSVRETPLDRDSLEETSGHRQRTLEGTWDQIQRAPVNRMTDRHVIFVCRR